MSYTIVYSSKTGNTKMLAETIRRTLPEEDCVYFGSPAQEALTAQRLYVGFWTDKGICDADSAAFLKQLKDKEVFLFGTAGFGEGDGYYDKILSRTQQCMDSSVRVVGTYMCQGRMPMSVRERYVKMQSAPIHIPNLDEMIQNFDKALTHPDEADLKALEEKVREQ